MVNIFVLLHIGDYDEAATDTSVLRLVGIKGRSWPKAMA